MSAQLHMPFYGKPNTVRLDLKVPKGFKKALVKHLLHANRNGKVYSSHTDFILSVLSAAMVAQVDEAEAYFNSKFKPPCS